LKRSSLTVMGFEACSSGDSLGAYLHCNR
jgi:hypothetical protein